MTSKACKDVKGRSNDRIIRKRSERPKAQPLDWANAEDMCDRSFGNDTDINKIVERFTRSGNPPPKPKEQFADVRGLQAGDLAQLICDSRNTIAELEKKKEASSRAEYQDVQARLKKLEEYEKWQSERSNKVRPQENTEENQKDG